MTRASSTATVCRREQHARGGYCRSARFCFMVLLLLGLLPGCASWWGKESRVKNPAVEHYRRVADSIAFEDETQGWDAAPSVSLGKTRPLVEPQDGDLWKISLAECIRIGLRNNEVVRQNAQFLSPGNPILANPDGAPSVYDAAIQNNGVAFGSRGVDATLSDFDPRLTLSTLWGRDENAQNSNPNVVGVPRGNVLSEETAQVQARLEQQFLSGGTLSLLHSWNYSSSNGTSRLFDSAYTGVLGAEFRQPLWAASGREFTAIAGPNPQRSRGFSPVNQGIVIATIQNKLTQIDFEENLHNYVREVGDLYWDLYAAWHVYLAEKDNANSAQQMWEEVKAKFESTLASGADEAQAEDAYHEAIGRRDDMLATYFQTESRLRRLLGLPIDDGRILFAVDPPIENEVTPNPMTCVFEALVNRLELQRQKANLHSLELQLTAAQNLMNPRLDFVAGYKINGFGDKLLSRSNADGITREGFHSAYGSLFRGKETSWDLGFEYSIPLWLRAEKSQVRQLELRLAKGRAALALQEDEITRELQSVMQTIQRTIQSVRTNRKRAVAAERRVDATLSEYQDAGRTSLDPVLRARISQTQTQIAYHRAITEYNKALRDLVYRTGRTLMEDGIQVIDPNNPASSLNTNTTPLPIPPSAKPSSPPSPLSPNPDRFLPPKPPLRPPFRTPRTPPTAEVPSSGPTLGFEPMDNAPTLQGFSPPSPPGNPLSEIPLPDPLPLLTPGADPQSTEAVPLVIPPRK